jgi:thiamine pyrophosphokinase
MSEPPETTATSASRVPSKLASVSENGHEPVRGPAVVVFSGGDAPQAEVLRYLPEHRFVIAADSGYAHARAIGVRVDVLVGDFDSLDPDLLQDAREGNTEVRAFPVDKDATDLEIAIDVAIDRLSDIQSTDRLPSLFVVAGGGGERLDHFMAEVSLLLRPDLASIRVRMYHAGACFSVVRPNQPLALEAKRNETVSLIPFGDSVEGVTTSGLRFPLRNEQLLAYRTRGVSNEATESNVTISIERGALLVVQPHALSNNR